MGAWERCRLRLVKIVHTLEEVKDWVERQVAPVLAVLRCTEGRRFADWLQGLCEGGQARWKGRHLQLLAQAWG